MAPPLSPENAYGRLKVDESSPSGFRDRITGAFPDKASIEAFKRKRKAYSLQNNAQNPNREIDVSGIVSRNENPVEVVSEIAGEDEDTRIAEATVAGLMTSQNISEDEARDKAAKFFKGLAEGKDEQTLRFDVLDSP